MLLMLRNITIIKHKKYDLDTSALKKNSHTTSFYLFGDKDKKKILTNTIEFTFSFT
jgi:hypothetical protein